jgi:hypothetical protein
MEKIRSLDLRLKFSLNPKFFNLDWQFGMVNNLRLISLGIHKVQSIV